MYFNDTLAGTNLSVNSSDNWDGYDSPNATWFENAGGVLNLITSQLTSFIDNWLTGKSTDDLTEGSTNFYDNQSWNQTGADLLFQDDIGADCSAGDFVKGVDDDGTLDCDTPSVADTNETARFDNLTAVDCSAGTLVIGVQNNGTVLCATDQDTNLTEDDVEGYIFDDDNTANLNLSGYNITDIGYADFDGACIYFDGQNLTMSTNC
jgi:hypothetical protein